MPQLVVLFVANFSTVANAQYLERLFSAYGEVKNVEVKGEGHHRYAEVTFSSIDDADTAVAALHYRYRTSPNVPLIVLYSKESPCVSEYGRRVGQEFASAIEERRQPVPLLLEQFDSEYERQGVKAPPTEHDIIPDGQGDNSAPMA